MRGRPLAPWTSDTYRHSLNAWILPTLGALPLNKITPAHVRRWHAHASSQTGVTPVRQAYAVLRAVLNTAVADEALHCTRAGSRGRDKRTRREGGAARRPLHDLRHPG